MKKEETKMAVHVTDADFKEKVLEAKTPVLVDFYAQWCGPCKMLAPVIDQLAGEQEGKAAVYKLDVDEAGETAQTYRVMNIPTLIFFKNGEEVKRIVGAVPKTEIEGILASL